VVVTPEELDGVDPKKTRTIDIEDFVNLDEIDPIYYDAAYYLVPDKGADKAYNLLLEAMREAGRVAIARVVIRTKEHLTAIRPTGEVMTMATMLFADEVVPPDRLDELADKDAGANERELEMARQLIDSLATDFEPDKYRDEYRERVLDLIERKAEGEEIAVQPAEEPERVPDLMAALEASIDAAREEGEGARASGDGARTRSSNGRKSRAGKSSSDGSGSRGGSASRGGSGSRGSKSKSGGSRKGAKASKSS
jgi:DNA end-binding protein Ku